MVDRRRYRTTANRGVVPLEERPRGLPQVYRGRARKSLRDLYDADHADAHGGGRFRWLISTCLAGTVGAIAIVVVIFGSMPRKELDGGIMSTLKRLQDDTTEPLLVPTMQANAGLNWAVPKSHRLEVTTGATSTRYVIHETLKQRRDGREYIIAKPYVRLVARLSSVPTSYKEFIPPLNPFKLYADTNPISSGSQTAEGGTNENVSIRVVELLGGILPREDGQELDNREVGELVEQLKRDESFAVSEASNINSESGNNGGTITDTGSILSGSDSDQLVLPNTTRLAKTVLATDEESSDYANAQRKVISIGKGKSLARLLVDNGAAAWQAEAMVDTARPIFREDELAAGQELHLTLVPSLTGGSKMEPAKFSIFAPGHVHMVTVRRDEAGEFVASKTPEDEEALARALLSPDKQQTSSNLYSSIYYANLLQNVEPSKIMKILRTHAYETDYRKRVSPGDTVEFFFSMKDADTSNGPPGELLFTQVTSSGEVSKFYRFRTTDGQVDFYDDSGNNAKKFLMRRPVRSADVRLTSGYGMRHHPLLNRRRMHTGVDWAARTGTPILAAGNGTIEYAARKGHYGNYVRIRHANGYQTAYAHMSRFGKGVKQGVKVRQGQIIGYIGSTGLSSGPHLHFEVLVNKQFVNPMSIKVPRQRQLKGRELLEFKKEKARIDDLMHRAPVMTASK